MHVTMSTRGEGNQAAALEATLTVTICSEALYECTY